MQLNTLDNLLVRSIGCGLTITMLGTSILTALNQSSSAISVNESVDSQVSTVNSVQSEIVSTVDIGQYAEDIEEEEPRETYLMYVDKSSVYYRSRPIIDNRTALGTLTQGDEVDVIDQKGEWCQCIIDDEVVYVHADLLVEECTVEDIIEVNKHYDCTNTDLTYIEGVTLTSTLGRVNGPSGEETYYNLNMKNCVKRMHDLGYEGEYWVRKDGVKMFGPYVMVAANFDVRPLGTIVETSLGTGCVCDTGDFVEDNPYGIDVATTW